ncbi:hypothetical protein DSECCO2_491690 [anaerobic digester metagenome]
MNDAWLRRLLNCPATGFAPTVARIPNRLGLPAGTTAPPTLAPPEGVDAAGSGRPIDVTRPLNLETFVFPVTGTGSNGTSLPRSQPG